MIRTIQYLILFIFYVAIFAVSVWALIDLLRRQPAAFIAAGKRTKGFWGTLLGVGTAVAFVALPWPLGIGALSSLAIGSAIIAGIYLADVKPRLGNIRGPRRPSTGGW